MAEGELFVMLMKGEKKLIDEFKRNRSDWGPLLARLYVTAEAWASQKGVRIEDIEILDTEMAVNNKQFSFRFGIKADAEKGIETNTSEILRKHGFVGPNGEPL